MSGAGQHYSSRARANSPYALPDIEVFEVVARSPLGECPACFDANDKELAASYHGDEHLGWYWWSCFPGCLPDGEATGPFDAPEEALTDARVAMTDDDDRGGEDW